MVSLITKILFVTSALLLFTSMVANAEDAKGDAENYRCGILRTLVYLLIFLVLVKVLNFL